MNTTTTFDETRFRTLLDSWNQHQVLRNSGAPVAALADSRSRLDSARLDAICV